MALLTSKSGAPSVGSSPVEDTAAEVAVSGAEPLVAPSGVKARGGPRPRPFPAGDEAGLSVRAPRAPLISDGSETRLWQGSRGCGLDERRGMR